LPQLAAQIARSIFGENRSGKSTILDMAQVVLTGGNAALLKDQLSA
jgi:ABC-type Na+ transport system ATPase subunit NatA